MSTPFVSFQQVAKNYRLFQALVDVSFDLYPGEIFGFIGPNGAGKTTTLKLLVGLLREFKGKISVGGLTLPQGYDEVHKLVGFLPQSPGFQNWRTINHALMSFGLLSGVSEADLQKRIPNLLERFDLLGVRHKKVKQLSGGMLQKVGLVQALLHNPKLLVLDEPLNNLDPSARGEVKQIIRELKAEGVTIIFSSHILGDVEDVADRIGIIRAGKMTFTGTVPQLKQHFGVPNDIQIEFSQIPQDLYFLEALPDVKSIEQKAPDKWLIRLENDAPFDHIVHELVLHTLQGGGRLRMIGNSTPSLDELYVRYFERLKREKVA